MAQAQRPIILVTGASRGIGKAAALARTEAGFDGAGTARTLKKGEGIGDSALPRTLPTWSSSSSRKTPAPSMPESPRQR